MRIGDKEWVSVTAKLVRDIRRVIDREFAKRVLGDLRRMQRHRFGEELKTFRTDKH